LLRITYFVVAILLATAHVLGCAASRPAVPPGTIPTATAPTISDEQYGNKVVQALSESYKIDYQHPKRDKIEEIVDRLTKAAKAEQHPWHVYLFNDPLKNAAATRGNHLFIWTGMLESTRSDGELAAILAHEIAHVIAGHTAEDPNEEIKRIMIQVAGVAAGVAVSVATGSGNLGMNVGQLASDVTTSVGEGLIMNPFSRENEHEADQIGVELMAEAKYDPQEAISFWERAARDPQFSSDIPFLSTHPAAPDRLRRLKEILPFAEARYRGTPLPVKNPGIQLANSSQPPSAASQRPTLLPAYGSPAGDSFDLRGTSKAEPAQGGPLPWADEWRVVANRTILYAEPSPHSRRIGEFRGGAVVRSDGRKNGWLRITRPDSGFLRESDLVPIFSDVK